jgi:hypothetical protein
VFFNIGASSSATALLGLLDMSISRHHSKQQAPGIAISRNGRSIVTADLCVR